MKKIILFLCTILIFGNTFATKIGYINTEILLKNSKQLKDSQNLIIKEFKNRDSALKTEANAIKKMLSNFKEVESDLTAKERKAHIAKISKRDNALKQKALKLKKQFSLRGSEELRKVQDSINSVISKFAKKNKFNLILYKEVAFVDDKTDITSQISKKLEAKYKK